MSARPILCGHTHAGRACTTPASYRIDAPGRHAVACRAHQAAVMRWAGRDAVSTVLTQDADPGQGTLFELRPTA